MATSDDTSPISLCLHAPSPAELATAQSHFASVELTASSSLASDTTARPITISPASHHETATFLSNCGAFNPDTFFNNLKTKTLGKCLLTADTIPSTQAVIQTNVVKLPDGTLCVADKQIGGKGRGGNTWTSPEGCLMFSACSKLSLPGERLPFVQYLVSLAVLQAVQAEAKQRLGPQSMVDIRIKWPNDLYSGGLKVGGVLCHSSYRDGLFHVIMGVGLNVSNREPTTCIDAMIEQEAAKQNINLSASVSRESLLAEILNKLEYMLDKLTSQGFAPFEQDYYASWLHSNQPVEVEDADTKERAKVTIVGLSTSGYLLAQGAGGQRYELHPDGNSLDFLKGLVRRKVQ